MAQPIAFINTSRGRVGTFLKAYEDLKSLSDEFTAVGGTTFTNAFEFSGEGTSTYDLTQQEYNAGLAAVGRAISAIDGGAVTAGAAALGDLYKLKL
jgi:hypothetical protein